MLSRQGAWVLSLVGGLRSCMLCSQKNNFAKSTFQKVDKVSDFSLLRILAQMDWHKLRPTEVSWGSEGGRGKDLRCQDSCQTWNLMIHF